MEHPTDNLPKDAPSDHLLPHHRAQLTEESGLSPDVIAARGYRSVTSKAELKRLGFTERQLLVPALLVPVLNVYGDIATYQIRPDQPRIDRKSDKPRKYETPGGSRMVVDVPPAARPRLGDPTVPLFITEGAKKADRLAQCEACTIALLGVWSWRGTNEQGGKVALPDFEAIALNDRQVYLCFDSDIMLKASVHRALERFGAWLELRGARVAYIYLPAGQGGKKQGAGDYLAAGHTLDDLLHLATETLKDVPVEDDTADGYGGASGLAKSLADQWRFTLLFDRTRRRWLAYRNPEYALPDEPRGIWRELTEEDILGRVSHALRKRLENGFSWSFLAGMERLLRVELGRELEPPPRHLVPFRNGVLCLSTMELQSHAPWPAFTWQLPFDFNRDATCPTIDAWLLGAQDKDPARVKVLKAFLRAVVIGGAHLQRFLELIGPAGVGKGTLQKLAMALVGLDNVHVTELKQLEQNRFETSNLIGKRLILITDSERYTGSVATLKALVGGDALRAEEKYAPVARHFVPEALVIISANQPIESTDFTSGLERRRIAVPFQHRPATPRKLIDFDRGHAVGEFGSELAGLVNSVLAIDETEMECLLRRTHQVVPTLQEAWTRSLTETNPLAAWLVECVVYDPQGRTYIGKAELDPVTKTYAGASTWLYANYAAFAGAGGNRKIVPLQSFRRLEAPAPDHCRRAPVC